MPPAGSAWRAISGQRRLEILREFETALSEPFAMLRACRTRLEAIRQLDATPRRNLIWLDGQTSIVTRLLAEVKAPIGGETALGLLNSATQLASRAVTSRQQAVSSGDMHPAWEAASAAAGALMLLDRASEELQRADQGPRIEVITPRVVRLIRVPTSRRCTGRSSRSSIGPLRGARLRRHRAVPRQRPRSSAGHREPHVAERSPSAEAVVLPELVTRSDFYRALAQRLDASAAVDRVRP